jgi:hypothetical protein
MFESILFFSLGYFFARVITPYSKMKADILLYWNQDCLGWRPLAGKSEMRPDMKYLAAIEVSPEQIQSNEEEK